MTAKRGESASDRKLLNRINRTPVTPDEVLKFLEVAEALPRDARCFEAHTITAARLHPGEFNKVTALMFRMEALSQLLEAQGAPGWTLPGPDGSVFADHTVFAAAALEPLVIRDGEIAFDYDTFLRRVLAEAELETHA